SATSPETNDGRPLERSSRTIGVSPADASARTTCAPMYPAPPVTSQDMGLLPLRSCAVFILSGAVRGLGVADSDVAARTRGRGDREDVRGGETGIREGLGDGIRHGGHLGVLHQRDRRTAEAAARHPG